MVEVIGLTLVLALMLVVVGLTIVLELELFVMVVRVVFVGMVKVVIVVDGEMTGGLVLELRVFVEDVEMTAGVLEVDGV